MCTAYCQSPLNKAVLKFKKINKNKSLMLVSVSNSEAPVNGKLYLSPKAKFTWLICYETIFSFEKWSPMTSFPRGKCYTHFLWASLWALHFFSATNH